jgi:DNA polymerase-3 subunit beta
LIDGTFPDYGRVIPQNNDKELVVDKNDFAPLSIVVTREPYARGRKDSSAR